jgi:diguanylate cyclase (GGDEF)-like protein/PAS domain S-box-containing protein
MADVSSDSQPCPLPENECERLRELRALDLIGGDPIEQIDRICGLARDLYKVPVALVSAVDRDRITFLALSGIELPPLDRQETFCAHVILNEGPLIVDDARRHPLFKDSPFVSGPPHVRFYAGVPLRLKPGINIGSLSILDYAPRQISGEETAHLEALADMIVSEIRGRHAARELKSRETRLAQTARLAKIGGWELKLPSHELIWDDQMYAIYGMDPNMPPSREQAIEHYDEDMRAVSAARLDAMATQGTPFDVELRGRKSNGDVFWVRSLAEAEMKDGEVARVFGVVQDITARKQAEQRIHELAYRDTLTGLPNRASFIDTLTDALTHAALNDEQVHLLKFDIDHFREINDALGHHTGDIVLQTIADALRVSFGDVGSGARVGGDEFTAILHGTVRHDQVALLAQDFVERARMLLRHEMAALPLGISVGLATYPLHGFDAETIIKNAEVALLQAKKEKRGKLIVFDHGMRKAVDEKNALTRRVTDGIARNEFVLFYQPIVRLRGGKVSGFEALMRWNDPVRGILPPAEFMAAFEEPELSLALGKVALELAVKQMRTWLDAGLPFGSVAINLSTAQFRLGDLAERILKRLAAARVPPQCLTIEVTENVYMDWGADVVAATVHKLHAAGVGIALDDFGTGYASLTHLRQFPIDKLKIDKSFVQSAESAAIVDAVINMGLSLGMQVVAEGVEQPEQVDLLRLKGCDFVQGYVFAKPMPADQATTYIADFAQGVAPSTKMRA